LLRIRIFTFLLIFTVLVSLALHTFPARAQPSYTPGVRPGDYVTYGEFSQNGTLQYAPPFPENVSTLKFQVESVNGPAHTVNATFVFTYKNGTQSSQPLSGNTETGQGNLFPYLVAGNLTAGDLLLNTPFSFYPYVFNETVERVYAGALRTVNFLNLTIALSGQNARILFYWDAQTGLVLDAAEYLNQTFPSPTIFSVHFTATETNVWTPSTGPDYSFDASSLSSGVLHRGDVTSFRLDLTSLNGFTGDINLGFSVPSSNSTQPPRVTLNPTSISLSTVAPTANAILTVSANSTTTISQFLINVNGTSGTISHQAKLLVVVEPPDFILSANPDNLTIFQGASKNSTITVTGRGGFTGTVVLQAQTQPFGTVVTAILNRTILSLNSTMPTATSTLTVDTTNSVPGTATIYLSATSGTVSRNVYLFVNVTGPDFRITANPTFLNLRQGETGQSTISLTSVLGFTGTVNLSTSVYGSVSAILSNTSLNLTSGGQANSTLTITVSAATPPGFDSIYVTGNAANSLVHTAFVQLNVTGPDFTLSASNYFLSLQAGQTANSTLTLSSRGGFSGTVALTVTTFGPVQPTVNPFSVTVNATQTSATALVTVTVAPFTPPTFTQVYVTATSGNIVHTVYIEISITGPDFSISTNPSVLSIPQGGSGQSTVSLSSIDNFSGNVTLSSSSLLLTSFSANPVNLASGGSAVTTLTIQAPLSTAPGSYFIGITANSGPLTRYTQVYVNVIGPDFSITASPYFLSIPQGGSGNSTISLTSIDNLKGTATLFAQFSGPVTVSPNSTTVALSPNSTSTTTFKFSTGVNVAPGYYYVDISASLGSITHDAYVSIQVTGPDFSIFSNPGSLTLQRGASGVSTIFLNSLDSFNGTISLTLTSYALTATPSNATQSLTPGGTASITITIQAPETTLPGTYYVLVDAISGNIRHSTQIFVQVIGPDFSIQANPAQLFIHPGESAQSTIQLTSLNGFSGNLTLSAFVFGTNFTLSPVNVTLSPAIVILSPGATSSATLTVSSTLNATGQNFSIYISAAGNNETHSTSVYVSIIAPTFNLFSDPSFLTVPQGGSATATVTATSINNFSGNVSLSVGSPFGITGSLTPQNITLSAGGSATSTLNLTVPSTTSPGFYTLIVMGRTGTLTRFAYVEVQVTGPAFTLSASPIFLSLTAGGSGNSTITLNGSNGFSGTISLSASSLLSGLTTSLSPTSVTLNSTITSASSQLTLTVSSDAPAGFYPVGITATSSGTMENITVYVHVSGGDFTLFASPSSVTLFQEGSTSTSLIVSGINGFSGLVNFTAYSLGYAPGLQESFSPLNVTISQSSPNATLTMTVSAPSYTPSGSYNITVVGVSYASGGFEAHTIMIQVTVLARPDFTITASPIFINIVQGTTGSFTISMTSNHLFSGNVSLTAMLTPPGPAAYFSNNTVFIGEGSIAVSTLTVAAGSSPAGYYNVTIEAVAGSLSHQVVVNIYIAPKPDFSIATGSTGLIIVSGASATSTVYTSPINGFAAPVTLSATGPAGFTMSYTINPILGGSGTATLTVTAASSVAAGSYIITVTGNSGSITHSLTLNVTVASSSKLTLSVVQVSWTHRLSLGKNGGSQTFTMTVKNTGKSPAYVQLLAAGNSTSLTSSFNQESGVTILSPGQSTTISLNQLFNNSSIGLKFNFTIQLLYGTSINATGNILSPQTIQAVKGSFTVVR